MGDDRLILALDQGTTSSRAIAFGRDGRPVAVAQQPFEQRFPSLRPISTLLMMPPRVFPSRKESGGTPSESWLIGRDQVRHWVATFMLSLLNGSGSPDWNVWSTSMTTVFGVVALPPKYWYSAALTVEVPIVVRPDAPLAGSFPTFTTLICTPMLPFPPP